MHVTGKRIINFKILMYSYYFIQSILGTGSDTLSGTWCKDLLDTIMQNTPHTWAYHTLQCFPPSLSEFFKQNSIPKEDKQQIKVN